MKTLFHDMPGYFFRSSVTNVRLVFFLKDGKKLYRVGERFRQPVMAETLKRLARKGVSDFYAGRIARLIHRDMVRNGGLIRKDDLAQVLPPIERRPVASWFDGLRVMTFPPPGAGRTLIEMLNIISQFPKRYRNPDRPRGALLLGKRCKFSIGS